ncbi:MAG: flagellar hook-basal body complex protein FliE [Candidatus Eisenbacteria bacterium]
MTFDPASAIPINRPAIRPGVAPEGLGGRGAAPVGGASFAETLKGYLQDVTRLEQEADFQVQALAEGKVSDPHEVMMAVEEANMALDLLIEIRNKLLEAYQELSRTSV